MKDGLRARVKAFFEEFPFVSKYAPWTNAFDQKPKVKRVDLDLLDSKVYTDRYIRRFGPSRFGERIRLILIGDNGKELAAVKPYDMPKLSFWHISTWLPEDIVGETVYEAIKELPNANQVKYVLEVKDSWGGSRSEKFNPDYGLQVILHKIPSGRPFSEWIAQLSEIASKELEDEIDKVDRV